MLLKKYRISAILLADIRYLLNAIAKKALTIKKKCPEFIILQDENSCTSKRYYSNMSVLIISNSDNTHANAVESELLERSTEVIRIDMDSILKLPARSQCIFHFRIISSV